MYGLLLCPTGGKISVLQRPSIIYFTLLFRLVYEQVVWCNPIVLLQDYEVLLRLVCSLHILIIVSKKFGPFFAGKFE